MNLRLRLGPFPNELDAVRSLHQRQDVATPDNHVDTMCRTCYILGDGWPCTVARLIEVLDAEIATNPSAGYDPSEAHAPDRAAGIPAEVGLREALREAVHLTPSSSRGADKRPYADRLYDRLAALLAAPAPGGLDVELLVGALRAVDERIVAEYPEHATELLDGDEVGRRDYAEALTAEYARLAREETEG